MGRGRKSKLKINQEEFRQYILDNIINEDGTLKSWRELWYSEKFKIETGMIGKPENNYNQSEGTISYWLGKLDLYEKNIYDYHVNVTKKINPLDIPFNLWSRKHNKNHKKKTLYLNFEELLEESRWKFYMVCLRLARWIDYGSEPDKMMTDSRLLKFNKSLKRFYELNGNIYEDYFKSEWDNLMNGKGGGKNG